MNSTAQIKKGKGIEGLFEGFTAGKPEEEKPIEVAEGRFQELREKYEKFLDAKITPWNDMDDERRKITDLLMPEDINKFLQITIQYEQHRQYCWRTGYFISRLVQNSYTAGHNEFILDTTALKEIDYLGSRLEGTKERPIELTIKGNAGSNFGFWSKDATFNIIGNARDYCGWGVENSTFKITNRETLKRLLNYVPKSNRVIYIHPNGAEEVIRKGS